MYRRAVDTFSFDLDSTLCDTRHRKGIVEKYKNAGLPIDWDEYAKACLDDAPTGLVAVVRSLQVAEVPWVVVSGRSEGARKGTLAWLERHGLEPLQVFLEDGDTENHTALGHTEWKARRVARISERLARLGYNVVAHFDDWSEVAGAIEEKTEGRVKGVTVTPPGMKAAWPDNPGEAAEVL